MQSQNSFIHAPSSYVGRSCGTECRGQGLGGNAHAANEAYVIEGAGTVYGMAGAEKMQATVLCNFAGKN
jgi:hypothetical protein